MKKKDKTLTEKQMIKVLKKHKLEIIYTPDGKLDYPKTLESVLIELNDTF